ISNLVKKVDDTWRMCIDFKNVNLTCPKDYYPLSEIDMKIQSVMGFPYKCFLDAYKGYHQIQMSKEDKEKATFYTDQGTYCYTKMLFGLKKRWCHIPKRAFQEMKRLIIELPTLTTPVPKETLYVYLIASKDAVSGVLMVDREGKQTPIRAGLILIDPTGMEYTYAIRLTFPSTINEAEYEALLAGLWIARKMKVQALNVKVDSNLVACQLNGKFMESSEGIAKYLTKAKEHATLFKKISIENIPQNQNQKANVLSKLASVSFNHLTKEVLVEVLNTRPVDTQEVNTIVEEEEDNWMTPIIKYLEEGVWPTNENEARTLQMKINQYVMEEGVLFKNSHLSPMLRCVRPLQENYIIREVYEGHAECMPKHGPLLEGPNKLKFIIVAIDYFTKWMEAKPLAKTIGKEFNEAQNEEEMRLNLDLIQESRETTTIREAKYKKKVEQNYNKRVWPVSFRVRDFVYRRNKASRVENQGKLGLNWEGSYRVVEAHDNGSYKLCTMNDQEVPRTWHAINLQNYFM
ncbi:reverse transcriptase domain-containing protein, partial [Tanacetum coccineum]